MTMLRGLWIIFVAIAAGWYTGTLAEAGYIDFDVDSDGNPIVAPSLFLETTALTTLYAPLGVIFSGPGGNDGGAILDQDSSFGVDARSGRNFLAFNTFADLSDGGVARGPETLTFATLMTDVSIWASGGSNDGSFLMEAYDDADSLVASATATPTAGTYGELFVSYAAGIRKVVLTSANFTFVYDDLSFTPVPEPGSLALLGLGALGVSAAVRRRSPRHRAS